jgi:hypothetical protein
MHAAQELAHRLEAANASKQEHWTCMRRYERLESSWAAALLDDAVSDHRAMQAIVAVEFLILSPARD